MSHAVWAVKVARVAAMTEVSPARRYRGQNASERQDERRARLLDAGLELFGTTGYAAASVKQVCRAAGLTDRYFYESFADREALLRGVYDWQVDQLKQTTLTALVAAEPTIEAQAVAGVSAFVRFVAADRRRARLIFVEVVGVSPALEQRRRSVIREFAQVIAAIGTSHLGTDGGELLDLGTMFFAGGLTELMVDWALDDEPSDLEDLTFVVVALLATAFDVMRDELTTPDTDRRARIAAALADG